MPFSYQEKNNSRPNIKCWSATYHCSFNSSLLPTLNSGFDHGPFVIALIPSFNSLHTLSNTLLATCASESKFDQQHFFTVSTDRTASKVTNEDGSSTTSSTLPHDNLILTICLQVVVVVLCIRQHRWPCWKRVSSKRSIEYLT